jgi:hypothetical protein
MGKLARIEKYSRGTLTYASEKETLPRLARRLQGLFDQAAAPDRSGLFLASSNAGFQSAVQFWADARRSGLAVANPELFPWTLANATGGYLSRHFKISGPNATYTGHQEALLAAVQQAREQLQLGRIDTAWIVAVDFAQVAPQRTVFSAVCFSTLAEADFLCSTLEISGRKGKPSAVLGRVLV